MNPVEPMKFGVKLAQRNVIRMPSALKVIFFFFFYIYYFFALFCVCVDVGAVFRNSWTSNFAGMARALSL